MFAKVGDDLFINLLHVTEIRKYEDETVRVFYGNEENQLIPAVDVHDFMKFVKRMNDVVSRLANGSF